MDFLKQMENTANKSVEYNGAVTENGAVEYKTTGTKLLDMNFKVSSYRHMSDEDIVSDFVEAFNENQKLAFTWLFFVRDVRGGLGERRLFRVCLKKLFNMGALDNADINSLCNLIMEYGRADDIYTILDCGNKTVKECASVWIMTTLADDIAKMKAGKSVSLLAKWLKSEKASSKESKRLAKLTAVACGMSMKSYRQTLSQLRAYIDVTEVKMSADKWNDIDYSKVPSKAGLNYSEAFKRHDGERYSEYLAAVERGEAKINAGTLYPYEILHRYVGWYSEVKALDPTLEEMWKALPNTVNGKMAGSTLVVADGSGSMTVCVGGETTALDVANSLAIYFSERATGPYKDKYITFSSRSQFVDFSKCKTLKEKVEEALRHNEVADTNIEAVFNLILDTAVRSGASQEDVPANILAVSDMEFNEAVDGRSDRSLFDGIGERFKAAGYKMPRLVFWNVNSRTCVVPIQENDAGVALVSGFSPNVADMVMSGETDPMKCLVETLMKDRYVAVREFWEDVEGDLDLI